MCNGGTPVLRQHRESETFNTLEIHPPCDDRYIERIWVWLAGDEFEPTFFPGPWLPTIQSLLDIDVTDVVIILNGKYGEAPTHITDISERYCDTSSAQYLRLRDMCQFLVEHQIGVHFMLFAIANSVRMRAVAERFFRLYESLNLNDQGTGVNTGSSIPFQANSLHFDAEGWWWERTISAAARDRAANQIRSTYIDGWHNHWRTAPEMRPPPLYGFGVTGLPAISTENQMEPMHSLLGNVDFGIPQMYILAGDVATCDIERMVTHTYEIYSTHTSERVVAGQSANIGRLRNTDSGESRYSDGQVIERMNIWLEAVLNCGNSSDERIRQISFWASHLLTPRNPVTAFVRHIGQIIRREGRYCFNSPRHTL